MGTRLKGITVILYQKTKTGVNAFGEDVFTESSTQVDNVLIAPSSESEILETTNLYGKKAVYTLAIPKDDTNDWTDCRISFFGEDFHSFGFASQGIDDLIPLGWNKKVTVERYG